MKIYDKSKTKDKAAFSLILCFCVVALVSTFAIKSNIEKVNESAKSALASEQIKIDKDFTKGESSDVSAPASSQVSSAKAKESSNVAVKSTLKETKDFVVPLEGNIKVIKDYSMDDIVYSATLDQYMTHSGIDLTSDSNKVVAIASGTVSHIESDKGYGKTIEIDHGNGYVSKYCNLSENIKVSLGDQVKSGDDLGIYSNTAIFENGDPNHLHFELLKNGKVINPAKKISFTSF